MPRNPLPWIGRHFSVRKASYHYGRLYYSLSVTPISSLFRRSNLEPIRYDWSNCLPHQRMNFHQYKEKSNKTKQGMNVVHKNKRKLQKAMVEKEAENTLQSLKEKTASIKSDKNENTKNSRITLLSVNTTIINLSKIKRYGTTVKAAELAQDILEEMERYTDICNSDQYTNMLMPNTVTYNAVLNCWAKCDGGAIAAENAEKVLTRMISRYKYFNDRNNTNTKRKLDTMAAKPDIISFHSVMDAWAKSGTKDAGSNTEQLFGLMTRLDDGKGIVPSPQTYAIILDAWAGSGSKDAAERATFILDEMTLRLREKESSAHIEDVSHLITPAFNSVIKVNQI